MGDRRPSQSPPPDAAAKASAPEAELSFEEALERLEAVVDRLERGDLELEAALTAFESGVALARRCAGQLDDAERRIEVLVREGEKWVARPFEGAERTEPGESEK
jgi:exodeoxyribonuclease VII small subunit